MDARCRIELLGGLRVVQGERGITRFRTQKFGALLGYLAYHLRQNHPREVLIELLWPEVEPTAGRNRLSMALSSLRRQLEPPGVPVGAILQADRFHVRLNPEAVTTDVAEFEAALRQNDLQRAIALYRGPLLPGYYEEWIVPQMVHLEALYEQARQEWEGQEKGERKKEKGESPTSQLPNYPITQHPTPNIHLPLQFTRFFGREEDIARLVHLLTSSPPRLLTLLGPGGSGKTRLAQEVARKIAEVFPGGVWFVPLADLSDSRLIPATILEALRLPRSQAEPLDQVAGYLNTQAALTLLLLDNMEHLLLEERRKSEDGAAVVRALLERVPTLTCLVTSRQRLDLEGEREFPVLPLPIPDFEPPIEGTGNREQGTVPIQNPQSQHPTPEHLMQCASVQLFLDRAQAVRPDFQVTKRNASAVAELCARLEGIPLAIELAAARVQVMTPGQMLVQLEHRFDFLVSRRRDATERHRTLHAAIEWSYRLLSPELRRFFAGLSVFRGGWNLEAAAAVCEEPMALDFLAQLRECSLILAQETAMEMRFRMLETLREYGWEQLTEEERAAVSTRHASYYEVLARKAGEETFGKEGVIWLDRVETDYDNMQEALGWALEADPDRSLRLANALGPFWSARGYSEGYTWLERALKTGAGSPGLRAHAMLSRVSNIMHWIGDYAAARLQLAEILPTARMLGDELLLANTLLSLGQAEEGGGGYAAARVYEEEALALFRELGDRNGYRLTLKSLGTVAVNEGDYARAQAYFEESLALARQVEGRTDGAALPLRELGRLSMLQGDYARATALLEEALGLYRQRKSRMGILSVLYSLGETALASGDYPRAKAWMEESLALTREFGDTPGCVSSLRMLALLALRQEDEEQASALYRESLHLAVSEEIASGIAKDLEGLGKVACGRQPARAVRLFGAAEAQRVARHAPQWLADRADYNLYLAAARAKLDEEAFAAAWAEGQAMTLEQAIAYALREDT